MPSPLTPTKPTQSLQVISLVCHLVEQRQERRPFLIAAPASVLPSWERELRAWAPALKVVSYKGAAEERQEVFAKQVRGQWCLGWGAGRRCAVLRLAVKLIPALCEAAGYN